VQFLIAPLRNYTKGAFFINSFVAEPFTLSEPAFHALFVNVTAITCGEAV